VRRRSDLLHFLEHNVRSGRERSGDLTGKRDSLESRQVTAFGLRPDGTEDSGRFAGEGDCFVLRPRRRPRNDVFIFLPGAVVIAAPPPRPMVGDFFCLLTNPITIKDRCAVRWPHLTPAIGGVGSGDPTPQIPAINPITLNHIWIPDRVRNDKELP